MKRTLEEKMKYNRKLRDEKHDEFAGGYTLAVNLYQDYTKQNKEGRRSINEIIGAHKELARHGEPIGKGFMCGLRDAAEERKQERRR